MSRSVKALLGCYSRGVVGGLSSAVRMQQQDGRFLDDEGWISVIKAGLLNRCEINSTPTIPNEAATLQLLSLSFPREMGRSREGH